MAWWSTIEFHVSIWAGFKALLIDDCMASQVKYIVIWGYTILFYCGWIPIDQQVVYFYRDHDLRKDCGEYHGITTIGKTESAGEEWCL